jgi:hypothetical protein
VIVNNVIYDPGSTAIQLNYSQKEWEGAKFPPVNCRVSIVGNVLLHGASTKPHLALVASKGDAYLEDNLALKRDGSPAPLLSGNVNVLKEKPAWPDGLCARPSGDVVESVIRHAGARPKDRDSIDRRIIRNLIERKGRVIDSQDEVGGYPAPVSQAQRLDIPPDRVDAWLSERAAALE